MDTSCGYGAIVALNGIMKLVKQEPMPMMIRRQMVGRAVTVGLSVQEETSPKVLAPLKTQVVLL